MASNLKRFIGTDPVEAHLAESTLCSRSSAVKSFNRFMAHFPDLMQTPLSAIQSQICTLFAKKNFDEIFRATKGLYFKEKLMILQNFIFNSEKNQHM